MVTSIADLLGSEKLVEDLKCFILGGVEQAAFHKMYVRSAQDADEDTFGQFVLVNGINEERYVFDLYKDEDWDAEEGELWHTMFLSNVVEHLDFTNKEQVLDRLGDSLEQTTLQHFISASMFNEVVQHLVSLDETGLQFSVIIPQQAQRMDINYLLIDEEITRIIHAILNNELTKHDIIDFGKLLLLYNKPFEALHFKQLPYFEEPFQRVLQNAELTWSEEAFVEVVSEVCGVRL